MQMNLFQVDWTPIYKAPVFDPRNPEIRQKLLALLGTGKDGEWFDVCPIYVFGDQGTVYRNHGAFGIWSSDFGTLLHFMAEDHLIEYRVVADGALPEMGGQSSAKSHPVEIVWTGKCDPKVYRGYGEQYRIKR